MNEKDPNKDLVDEMIKEDQRSFVSKARLALLITVVGGTVVFLSLGYRAEHSSAHPAKGVPGLLLDVLTWFLALVGKFFGGTSTH
jgi:hypothetical protein